MTEKRADAPREANRRGSEMPDDYAITVEGLHKSYGRREVLKGIDLRVRTGTVTSVLGPSGSGKSTLLRCINYLEHFDAGRILVNGETVGWEERDGRLRERRDAEIARARCEVGMVFQAFNLFPNMTAKENISIAPRKVKGLKRADAEEEASALLARVGLRDRGDSYPAQLSGGQQQRVAIARALAMHPAVMLFDEATSALDPESVGDVLEVIRELAMQGTTMLVVTHEVAFAREVSEEVIFMDGGIVVEQGQPNAVIDTPAEARTRQFLSRLTAREGPRGL